MSREADLYKDKIEVSLDGRQIFYLFFGGAVIVGLVFVLGVMVGRRVEARGHIDRARVAATVDPLAALDRLEGGNGLSFQGALRGGDAPASDVEKQIAAMEAKPADAKADKKPEKKEAAKAVAEEPKAELKAEAKKDDPKSEPKSEVKKDEAKKDETKKSDKKDEAKKSEKTEKAEKSEKKDEAKKDETKSEKSAEKTEKTEKTEKKDGEKKQKYTLQLSAFQEKKDAEALVESVKAAGYEAYISEGVVDGKQYFRVRTGTYKSQDAANEAKADIEKVANKSAIVTRI